MYKVCLIFLFFFSSLSYSKSGNVVHTFDERMVIFDGEANHLMASEEKREITEKELRYILNEHNEMLSENCPEHMDYFQAIIKQINYFLESSEPVYYIEYF